MQATTNASSERDVVLFCGSGCTAAVCSHSCPDMTSLTGGPSDPEQGSPAAIPQVHKLIHALQLERFEKVHFPELIPRHQSVFWLAHTSYIFQMGVPHMPFVSPHDTLSHTPQSVFFIPLIQDECGHAVVFVGPHEHHSNLLPWREVRYVTLILFHFMACRGQLWLAVMDTCQ